MTHYTLAYKAVNTGTLWTLETVRKSFKRPYEQPFRQSFTLILPYFKLEEAGRAESAPLLPETHFNRQ